MNWRLKETGSRAGALAALPILALLACSDFLDVQDPGRFTDEALNTPLALTSVANGVEDDLHGLIDEFAIDFGLMGDEYMHTGTWNPDEELDTGRSPNLLGGTAGWQDNLLAVRTASQKAQERFLTVMGDSANRTLLMGRVVVVEAFTNLYMGMHNCENPASPGGEIISDIETIQLSIPLFTKAAEIADDAGSQSYEQMAIAGRARAKLFSGDLDGALADAQLIPDDFVATAKYDAVNSTNSIVTLSYRGRLKAFGLDQLHWSKVDTIAGFMRDPYTGQHDPRLAFTHPANERGADGVKQHYNEEKYNTPDDDINIVSGWEMRLIEAEVHMRKGNLAAAMNSINYVRANAGLDPVSATTPDKVQEHLLWERFAQLYLEGLRFYDLHRFQLVRAILGPDRPTQFPLHGDEITLNPNTRGSLEGRCFPKS